jgi:hypothetical protein
MYSAEDAVSRIHGMRQMSAAQKHDLGEEQPSGVDIEIHGGRVPDLRTSTTRISAHRSYDYPG